MSAKISIHSTSDSAWASSTDLMSGLMIVFLFIAIVYMQNVSNIADDWAKTKDEIYNELHNEFKEDLDKWDAAIIKESLTIRFREPRVLFEVGKSSLKPRFRNILDDFFPRYVRLLNEKFSHEISEIRIEGHTSSEWNGSTPMKEAYFKNLKLSNERSHNVILFCLQRSMTAKEEAWIKNIVVAVGMSSSHLIYTNGKENESESRRVEFRVRTNAEEKLSKILSTSVEGK